MANLISMADFAMSTPPRRALAVPPEYARAVADFLRCFELVFGDADWPVTLSNLQDDAQFLIETNGTFLEPGVADESSNWHNRGNLLASYRRLRRILAQPAYSVITLHPCGHATRAQPQPQQQQDDFI